MAMRNISLGAATPLLVFTVLFGSALAGADLPSGEAQVAAAILAAPAELREGAAVLGYDAKGAVVKLRDGKNELVCLANDPDRKSFSVACYHKDLEPYMARGRELLGQKINGSQRDQLRWKEVAEGKLALPREPRTLYVLSGSSFDPGSGTVTDAYRRWVIYVPFATPESTGLSTKASENAPWLMNAGTAGAHIMINPKRP